MTGEPSSQRIGATSLMYACQQGKDSDVIKIISAKPGSVNERERSLKTALHYCAESGEGGVKSAQALLDAAPQLVSSQDQDGYSPLHLAVIAGNVPLAKLLLSRGAPVNAQDNEGHTSAHWATVCGEIDSLELVLSKGGNPNLGDMHGGCPLHYAAQMCGPGSDMPADRRLGMAALRILLSNGSDPNLPDNHGRQPILWAASAGSSEAILVLVNAGASVEAADKDGLTALHCAGSRGHTDCVETLISLCNAEVDVIDNNGCSALFYAVTLGHADATQSLLNHGANTNRQDRKGRTAVHCGAAKGQMETLKVVGNWGGNLWQRTVRGDYPLHDAVASGRIALVQWLLNDRPDSVNAPNNDGRCPLHVASIHNNIEMCKTLLDSGSLVNPVMRTSKGALATPLDTALHKGHRGCAKYLQLHGGVPSSRLNSESAALRGLNNRVLTTHNEVKNENEENIKIGDTIELKESKTVNSESNSTTITTHKEITMSGQRPRILQVYVEDDVMIRRIRHHEGSDSSIEERVRRRRRKRKTKKLSDQTGKVSPLRRFSQTSEDDSIERPKSSKVNIPDVKINLDQTVQTEKIVDGLEGTESISIQTESKDLTTAVEESGILKQVNQSVTAEVKNDNENIDPDENKPNVQVITAIVHSEADPENLEIKAETETKQKQSDIETENNQKQNEIETENKQNEIETETKQKQNEIEIENKQKQNKIEIENKKNEIETEEHENIDVMSEKLIVQTEAEHEQKDEISEPDKEIQDGSVEKSISIESQKQLDTNAEEVSIQNNPQSEELVAEQADILEAPNGRELLPQEKTEPKSEEEILDKGKDTKEEILDEGKDKKEEIPNDEKEVTLKNKMDTTSENIESYEMDAESKSQTVQETDDLENKSTKVAETEQEKTEEIENIDALKNMSPSQKISFDETENENLRQLIKNEFEKNLTQINSIPDIDKNETFKVLNDEEIARTLINTDKGLIKVLDDTSLPFDAKDEKRRKIRKRKDERSWRKGRSRESFEVLNLPDGEIDDYDEAISQATRTPIAGESHLPDSGIEPSPRRGSSKRAKSKDRSKIPRACRKGHESDHETSLSTVSVTQAVQYSVRKYHLERRIFHQLLELKRLQIRAGRASEAVLVKRLVDDYRRAGLMLGLQQYDGVYTFRSFEKYLYEQLRLLQSSEKRIIPRLKSTDDLERLTAVLKKTRAGQEILASVPNNPALCTYQTHRCHHATHAYTGIPCAAYITRPNHHTMPKSAPYTGFLPKIVNDENHGEVAKTLRYVDPSRPLTLELSHGPDKQIITLPTEKLDKSKRYFVTFTIKSGEQKKNDIKHNHATSI